MESADCVMVLVTVPSEDLAEALAREAVDARAAASVQVSGPISSTYRWQGGVHHAREWTCAAFLTHDAVGRFAEIVRARHPYVLPQIIVLPLGAADERFLDWIRENMDRPA